MGRTQFCTEDGLKKGAWTAEEDQKLIAYVQKHGEGSWRTLPEKAGLQRWGKSCRLRWFNYLRPGIKRGDFTSDEDQTIIQLHAKLGNRWAAIARYLPKRTDNEIKNYRNAHLKKRLASMGIDPVTHKPIPVPSSSNGNSNAKLESATTKTTHEYSEPTVDGQPKSRPTSTSALLLNKLATRITTLQCADSLRACQSSTSMPMSSVTSKIFLGNNTSLAWLDDVSDDDALTITALNCLDDLLSPNSGEHDADYNSMEYPLSDSDALTNILPEIINNNAASEPDEPELASLPCMDVTHDRQKDLPRPTEGAGHDITTTSTTDGEVSIGDLNFGDDHMIYDKGLQYCTVT